MDLFIYFFFHILRKPPKLGLWPKWDGDVGTGTRRRAFGDVVTRGDARQGTRGDSRSGTRGAKAGMWGRENGEIGYACCIAEKQTKVTINRSKKLISFN